jgi:hypothetical protein
MGRRGLIQAKRAERIKGIRKGGKREKGRERRREKGGGEGKGNGGGWL